PTGAAPSQASRGRVGGTRSEETEGQRNSESSRSSADFGRAPTSSLTTSPFWNTPSVGILRIRYFWVTSGFSSTLSFTISSLSPCSAAIASSTGATILHGPHHSAQ